MEFFVLRVIFRYVFIHGFHHIVSNADDIADHSLAVPLRELVLHRDDSHQLDPVRSLDPHIEGNILDSELVVLYLDASLIVAVHPDDPIGHDD